MNLVLCGILTSLVVVYCVVWDETLVFNMMMCVLCVLAIVSVWSQDSDKNNRSKHYFVCFLNHTCFL